METLSDTLCSSKWCDEKQETRQLDGKPDINISEYWGPCIITGLTLLEQLAVNGYSPPVTKIMGLLTTMNGLEAAKVLILSEVMNLSSSQDLLRRIGASVNGADSWGNTVLHNEIMYGRLEVVEFLLKTIVFNVDIPNKLNKTPIELAAEKKDLQCFQMLLDAGAEIDTSILKFSMVLNSVEFWQMVVKGLRNSMQVEAGTLLLDLLFRAVKSNKSDCVRVLIAAGVNVNVANENGDSPLHICAKKGFQESLTTLLESEGIFVDQKNKLRLTPLIVAVIHMHAKCVQLLITAGANVNEMVYDEISYRNYRMNGKRDGYPYTYQLTPLQYALLFNSLECVRPLINAGANLNEIHCPCEPLLHVSVLHGLVRFMEELLNAGVEVNMKNFKGETALHVAVKKSYLPQVKVLLRRQANPNIQDNEGNTPFHVAVRKAVLSPSARMIFCAKLNDSVSSEGDPVKIVNILLSYHADIMIPNKEGLTAKDLLKSLDSNSVLF